MADGAERFLHDRVTLHPGDCLAVLAALAPDSIDSCVTDAPYHLSSIVKRFGGDNAAPAQFGSDGRYARASAGFMGKRWDGGDVAFRPETWAAVLRVLKPGAHLIAMGGTRTYHRLACAIEDAGFEIRDTVSWLYGSGFPKSHDAAQSIEKLLTTGNARRPDRDLGGLTRNRFSGDIEGGLIANTGGKLELTTAEAQAFEGWGTALKPACELIVLARKPLSEGTVAANVLRWGTGAINVDACRVGTDDKLGGGGEKAETDVKNKPDGWDRPWMHDGQAVEAHAARVRANVEKAQTLGRWPANVVHDGSDEVVAAFPDTGISAGGRIGNKDGGNIYGNGKGLAGEYSAGDPGYGDSGSAARFFYTAKADADDRLGSKHPTVKPVDLMQWLVRLVTPRAGVCLDPFAGTGTTGEAAFREGMRAVLIEAEAEYCADIRRRMALALAGPVTRLHESIKAKNKPVDHGPLFGGQQEAAE